MTAASRIGYCPAPSISLPAHGAALVLLLSLTSCYSFIGRYTLSTKAKEPHTEGSRRYWYVDVAKRNVGIRERYTKELFSCTPVAPSIVTKDALRAVQRTGQPRNVTAGDSRDGILVFRIGLIADVHIRQPSVKLFNDALSRNFRYVVESFERNGYQEAFGSAGLVAMVSAFNQLDSVEDKPRLIMNAGDAIDAGTIEEAYDFASAMHYLRYPSLYTPGNHDLALFGNYKSKLGYTKDAGPTFYPVGQRVRFLRYFDSHSKIGGFREQLVPLPNDFHFAELHARWAALDVLRENDPGVEAPQPQINANTCGLDARAQNSNAPPGQCKQATFCSGFDLYGPPSDGSNCDSYPGYYAVILPATDGSQVQLITLNTARDENEWGAGAAFDEVQRLWLAKQLKASASATIILAHHRPAEVPGLMPMLDAVAAARPLVVLSGHTHGHATEWHGHFWELNTGALGEFPAWARLVEIRRSTAGRYYLNARTIRPQLPVLASPPDLTSYGVPRGLSPDDWDTLPRKTLMRLESWFESQFAVCDAVAAAPVESQLCQAGQGRLLSDSAQCAYLGTLYDHLFVPDAFLGKPSSQPAEAARREANVILDVSP